MVGMKDMLTSEKMYLEEVIKKAKLQLKKAGIQGDILENKLRISVDKERIRYYKCTPDNKKGSYILKKDLEVAKKLAQNEYNYKLLKLTQNVQDAGYRYADYSTGKNNTYNTSDWSRLSHN